MKKKNVITWMFLILLSCTSLWSLESSNPKDSIVPNSAVYLGQTPPGDSAIVFAPGFICNENNFAGNSTFSPDWTEFYFSITNNKWDYFEIMVTKFKNGKWTIPAKAGFFEKKFTLEPFITPDGNRIYFNAGDAGNTDIWYCERKGETWDLPIKLPEPVNSSSLEWFPSVSKKNTLFFCRNGEIYYSIPQNGNFNSIVNIGSPINMSKITDGDPYISPNEDYLIFLSVDRSGGYGQGDLYISYKKENGSWTNPKNLGSKVNTDEFEFGPSVTPDGKYFQFSRRKQWMTDIPSKIYWIKSDFIDLLR